MQLYNLFYNQYKRRFEFLVAYDGMAGAWGMKTGGTLVALNALLISNHGLHITLFYDSRNSNSLNLSQYINCNFKNAFTKLCFQFSLYYYCTLQIRFLFTPVNHALLSFNSCIFKVLPCILKARKKGHSTLKLISLPFLPTYFKNYLVYLCSK